MPMGERSSEPASIACLLDAGGKVPPVQTTLEASHHRVMQ
jgi:hypothetical protein